MPGIDVSREDLAAIGGLTITDAHFDAVDRRVRSMLAAVYRPPLDAATGRASSVLSAVYTSAALRILANPMGARSISLGSASITTGGSDVSISQPLSLTAEERADLAELSANYRRPAYLRLSDPIQASVLPNVRRDEGA